MLMFTRYELSLTFIYVAINNQFEFTIYYITIKNSLKQTRVLTYEH